jgi:hypothetical protein
MHRLLLSVRHLGDDDLGARPNRAAVDQSDSAFRKGEGHPQSRFHKTAPRRLAGGRASESAAEGVVLEAAK